MSNPLYGKLDTDEMFNLKIQRINTLRNAGYPVQWFRNHFSKIMLKRGNKWWDMDDLAKVEPMFDVDIIWEG